jgi:hypothetical protein
VTALVYAGLILASYRITRFFVRDSLIGFSLESESKMSQRLDAFCYTPEGSNRNWATGFIGDLLTCVWCLGMHVSWILVCIWFRAWPWELGVDGWISAFAVAGGAGFISSRMNA